jgi:hypothetical protein
LLDNAMSQLRRVFARIRRQPVPVQPWTYRRIATPEEIERLTKDDLRPAA